MHQYPVRFFDMGKSSFQDDQLSYLMSFENTAKEIKLETDIPGLRIDFNSGVRVQVPEGDWHIRISDSDTELVAFDEAVSQIVLISSEKYLINWHVEAYLSGKLVFAHTLDLTGQKVCIFMAGSALGDTIGVLPYLYEFRKQYHAEVVLVPPEPFVGICQEYFSDIPLVAEVPEDCYATYCLAVFDRTPYLIADDSRLWSPDMSCRSILRLHGNAKPVFYYPTAPRQIREKYVCIAVQASGLMKRWLFPGGWDIVVSYLKSLGYRVLCIDGTDSFSDRGYSVNIPRGAENFTGMLPLTERVNLLAYADLFIGVSSGLSWLANACYIPVVLISGFTLPVTEFDTPYRVTNDLVCHGCYNDIRVNWKEDCPYHRGTDREYECAKMIHPKQVIAAIDRMLEDKETEWQFN